MNGRVYDYRLGRFLSVDPIISNPANSKSINPYSYIGNNPLSGTDPTGYEAKSICEGTGRASNCSTGGLDPNETVGMKWTVSQKRSDGTTLSYTRIEMFANAGATGQGPLQGSNNPTNVGSPGDTSRGWFQRLKDRFNAKREEWRQGVQGAFRSAFAGLNPWRSTNEIYAEARQDSAQRADALGTGIGGAAYDAGEEVAEQGVFAIAFAASSRLLGKALEAIGMAREGGIAVLGHYPGYVNTAESIGARYFNVPAEVWARMSPAEQWAANAKFLDRLVMRGDTVILSTPASAARAGSWFSRELEYLSSRGYTLSAEGTRMLPRGP